MITRILRQRLVRDTRGVAMVEFALILTILLTILLGIIQFGLIWYTKYAAAGASRQGARYGVLYDVMPDGKTRKPPSAFSPTIEKVTEDYLVALCPTLTPDMYTITPSGPGYTTGAVNSDLTVTVTCQNPWNLLGWLMPSLSSLTFNAATTMKCE
jgi:Flp pilus assembly protein TadG